MASTAKQFKEILNRDKRIINCGALTRSEMEECLREMSSAFIKELTLVDFDHFKPLHMFHAPRNYIIRAWDAFLNNVHIEVLELGNEFVRSFNYYEYRKSFIDSHRLLKMRSLSTLSLHNDGWEPAFFDTLQRYLTDPRCTLQTLELKDGMTAPDFEQLKTTFLGAHSLRFYKGAYQKELQAILDNKISILEDKPIGPRP